MIKEQCPGIDLLERAATKVEALRCQSTLTWTEMSKLASSKGCRLATREELQASNVGSKVNEDVWVPVSRSPGNDTTASGQQIMDWVQIGAHEHCPKYSSHVDDPFASSAMHSHADQNGQAFEPKWGSTNSTKFLGRAGHIYIVRAVEIRPNGGGAEKLQPVWQEKNVVSETYTVQNGPVGDADHSICAEVAFPEGYDPSIREWLLFYGQEGSGAHHWLLCGGDKRVEFGVWSGPNVIESSRLAELVAARGTYKGLSRTIVCTTYDSAKGAYSIYSNGVLVESMIMDSDQRFDIKTPTLNLKKTLKKEGEKEFSGTVKRVAVWDTALPPRMVGDLVAAWEADGTKSERAATEATEAKSKNPLMAENPLRRARNIRKKRSWTANTGELTGETGFSKLTEDPLKDHRSMLQGGAVMEEWVKGKPSARHVLIHADMQSIIVKDVKKGKNAKKGLLMPLKAVKTIEKGLGKGHTKRMLGKKANEELAFNIIGVHGEVISLCTISKGDCKRWVASLEKLIDVYKNHRNWLVLEAENPF